MIRIRKVMGRELPFLVGYSRVQFEMDKILINGNYDVEISYDYYKPPKTIADHFIKRLITYPRMLRKSEEKDTINHIIVQHLSDLARKLNPDRTIIHLLDIWNFIKHSGLRNSSLVNNMRLKGLKSCKHIIAISEFSKQEAVEKLGIDEERITVIKCGVNRDIFHPTNTIISTEKLKLLHVGTESGRKEFLTLLYALKELMKYNKNIILFRVGKPEYIDKIKKLGLESNIRYISEISDVELNVLYNLVDLYIFPSSYEGYGLSIMEALSCGTPVICSDIPVFKELYKGCVEYFTVKNYKLLANKIIDFLNDNYDKYIPFERGLKLAKENTWKKYTDEYYNYIKERFA